MSVEDRLRELRRRRSAKWTAFPPDVLPAFVAEMDFPLADPVREALAGAIEAGDAGYANPAAGGLADALASFAYRRLGWRVDPARVRFTSDVLGGIRALLRVMSEPGRKVMVNPPVYHPFFFVIDEVGCEVVEAPLGEDGRLDVEAIERGFAAGARALILCSPHNPNGTVHAREELEAVASLAAAHDAWVLADEIHAPLTLPGARHVPFLEVSDEAREHGVALISASKAFNVAGLMCAQIVTASERATAAVDSMPLSAFHCGHLGAVAARAAFERGDAWLDDVLGRLDRNRALLGERLAERLPEVGYRPPQAGYLAWLDCRLLGLGDDPAEAMLERGRLAVSPGPQFGTGGAGFVRLNVGTYPELVEEAVGRMSGLAHCG